MRFKLLAGCHIQDDPRRPKKNEKGEPMGFEDRVFRPGDVVESDKDLAAMFGANKFENLDGTGNSQQVAPTQKLQGESAAAYAKRMKALAEEAAKAAAAEPQPDAVAEAARKGFESKSDHLESMSPKELVALAQEEEIDLRGVNQTKKDDLVRAIRGALAKV